MSKKPPLATFAEIAPAIPLSPAKSQTYTYQVSETGKNIPRQRSTVTIPFGHRAVTGIVLKLHHKSPPYPTKPITSTGPTTLTKQQVEFAQWIADTTHSGLGYTLRLFRPPLKSQPKQASPPTYSATDLSPETKKIISTLQTSNVAIIDKDQTRRQHTLNQLTSYYLQKQKQILSIVPEKWMLDGPSTPYAAHLPTSQLNSTWHAIRSSQPLAIRGTQKALFLPFSNLGLIIVEEEQLPAHKLWDQHPRIHNVLAAQGLAQIHTCPILYTSSFPSLRLQHALATKQVISITSNPVQPKTKHIPFDNEDTLKKSVLPEQVVKSIKKWLRNKETILIFYNRRNARHIYGFLTGKIGKAGVKKIRISTASLFTSHPHTNFDHIIWLQPEQTLTFPDYRSYEHSLITLARLQRKLTNPARHPIILISRRSELLNRTLLQPLDKFRTQQLAERTKLHLPPTTDIVRLTITARTQKSATQKAQTTRRLLEEATTKTPFTIRGPLESKIAKNTHHLILRGPLETLFNAYKNLDVTSAEPYPENIL